MPHARRFASSGGMQPARVRPVHAVGRGHEWRGITLHHELQPIATRLPIAFGIDRSDGCKLSNRNGWDVGGPLLRQFEPPRPVAAGNRRATTGSLTGRQMLVACMLPSDGRGLSSPPV
jgi:hypothetical protein